MDTKIVAVVLMLPLILNGCSTAPKSILLGAGVGAVAGGAMGQGASQNSAGTAIGALIGAGIGSLIGYGSYSQKNKTSPDTKTSVPNDENFPPQLTKPRVRSYMVPDSIEGNKYIKSHRVFILEDPGSWSKD
jgi:hypothetical protein